MPEEAAISHELKKEVHMWLAVRPKRFFSEGMQKTVQQWAMYVEKQGNYIEK
jgi:hypothetical protein